jgi:hypothetical protein
MFFRVTQGRSKQESALVSDTGALIVAVLIALPATYVIWALWSWWDLCAAGLVPRKDGLMLVGGIFNIS